MKPIPMLAALSLLICLAGTPMADEPVRVNDLSGNVKARLIGAKRSQGRGAWLIAKLQTIEKERREIHIVFPAHSFTTHEATLKAIVQSCSDWGDALDHSQWSRVKSEVIFSVPPKGAHFSGGGLGEKSLDHCYLVSLKLEPSK
jgi:hypothetical protein